MYVTERDNDDSAKGGDCVKENRKKIWKKLNGLFCVCMACLLIPLNTMAAQEEKGALTIKHLAAEVDFTFYKVADFSERGIFELVGTFEEKKEVIAGLDTIESNPEAMTTESWADLAYTLDAFVLHEKVRYDFIERTDEAGLISVDNMDKGLYLILGEKAEINGKMCTPNPLLVTLPTRDVDGNWTNQVALDYSSKLTPDKEFEEYNVIKIWDDENNEEKRPEEGIKVTLYKDGEVYEEVILNAENKWSYTWTGLPEGSEWKMIESEVPKGYQMNSFQDGKYHVIENIYKPETANPPGGSGGRLPQTGQLWWPVPVLAFAGLVLFATGWVKRNREER